MIITWSGGGQVRITCVLSIGEIHGVIKDFPARNEMNARRPSRDLLFVNERGDNEIALPASEGAMERKEVKSNLQAVRPSRGSQSEGREKTKQQLFAKQSLALWQCVLLISVSCELQGFCL